MNELKGGAETAAHLLEFDSIHGRWRTHFGFEGDTAIQVGTRRISFTSEVSPGDVPWGDLGCDIVLECAGKFLSPDRLPADGLRPNDIAIAVALERICVMAH